MVWLCSQYSKTGRALYGLEQVKGSAGSSRTAVLSITQLSTYCPAILFEHYSRTEKAIYGSAPLWVSAGLSQSPILAVQSWLVSIRLVTACLTTIRYHSFNLQTRRSGSALVAD